MKNIKIEFNTRGYVFSHGREPRGYGSWAFNWGTGTQFAPTGTYAEAKRWAAETARASFAHLPLHTCRPGVVIEVCS
jgi:hypothetical protein